MDQKRGEGFTGLEGKNYTGSDYATTELLPPPYTVKYLSPRKNIEKNTIKGRSVTKYCRRTFNWDFT
jgi:hypothetical protein